MIFDDDYDEYEDNPNYVYADGEFHYLKFLGKGKGQTTKF